MTVRSAWAEVCERERSAGDSTGPTYQGDLWSTGLVVTPYDWGIGIQYTVDPTTVVPDRVFSIQVGPFYWWVKR